MPVTPRLMPRTGLSTMTPEDYFRAQWSAWSMVQTLLSLFAVFVIVRSCLRRAYALWARSEALSCSTADGKLKNRLRAGRMVTGRDTSSADEASGASHTRYSDHDVPSDAQDSNNGADSPSEPTSSRRPPAPPLPAPELSTAVFTVDTAAHRQDSFIHQPNPDYMSSTADLFTQSDGSMSSPKPRRRSYTRSLSLSVSMPENSPAAAPETVQVPAALSSTHPTTNPLPSGGSNPRPEGRGWQSRRDVDVRGEIISVINDEGAGWTRHTRVYGRGVCLACAASGGGSGGGGFYGTTVAPEEMHHQ